MKIFKAVLLVALVLVLIWSWNLEEVPEITLESGETISLYVHETGEVLEIPLEEYVVGVVAAEMPAAFPMEALKAQAVAARTYVLKRVQQGENVQHAQAVACDDPQHFQAWISPAQRKENWSWDYADYEQKIKQAVAATQGQVLIWEDQLIDPVYHASCGGEGTRNSEEVWSSSLAYLRAVDCPYDADPQPFQSVLLEGKEIISALQLDSQKSSPPVGVIAYAATGNPEVYLVDGQEYSATELRQRLNLRSMNFSIENRESGWEVQTIGHGHGVGMCQYGAKGYAEQGYDYQAILQHYYTGVSLANYQQLNSSGF